MAYNSLVTRTDAQATMPEEVSKQWLSKATEQSAAMTLFQRIPVSRKQTRFPVLQALPTAYFVTGEAGDGTANTDGYKQTSKVAWANKYLNVEEIAVIVPVPEAVLDDSDEDMWGQIEPLAVEAIGRTLDGAVFFGSGAPSTWPTAVRAAAVAAGNAVELDADGTAATGAAFGQIDELISTVELDGYDVTGYAAARKLRGILRRARATDGQRLDAGRVNGSLTELDGAPIVYPMRGMWPADTVAFAGDFATQFVLGVRQDITVKLLDQAVITDPATGAIVYNLPQQDMVALRFVMRMGWQVANLINNDNPNAATRYPVGVLTDGTPDTP